MDIYFSGLPSGRSYNYLHMGSRSLLDFEVWCPFSGAVLEGKKIGPHKVPVMQCSNGTLFAMCNMHRTRIFCADWTTIRTVMKTVTVLRVTDKPARPNRGATHGSTQKSI
jgi:hypothetical protein